MLCGLSLYEIIVSQRKLAVTCCVAKESGDMKRMIRVRILLAVVVVIKERDEMNK